MKQYLCRPIELLLVDDSALDAELLRSVLPRLAVAVRLRHVSDGAVAREFLERALARGEALPDVILLDLRMPRMNGFETLAWLKGAPALREIPAVVLSGSERGADVREALRLRANGYLAKPFELRDLRALLLAFSAFWLSVVRLPSRERGLAAQDLAQGWVERALPGGLRVLYVEDSALDADALLEVAEDVGMAGAIERAASGPEAIARLGRPPPPDVVLLDLRLPGMPGIEVLRAIKGAAAHAATQVIGFSGSADAAAVQEAYAEYLDAFVPKPRDAAGMRRALLAIAHWYAAAPPARAR